MRRLNPGGSLSALSEDSQVLFVQFGAETCGPCAAIARKIDSWAAGRPTVDCVYVPIEDFPALAAEHSVFTVPTILVFVENKLTLRESGCFSLEQVFDQVGRYLRLLST